MTKKRKHRHRWGIWQCSLKGVPFRVCRDQRCRVHKVKSGKLYSFNDFS